uniref:uncharacterized protein LOC120342897 isoform X1 n=1 Tax=Styela clava TaxID=7725 RepID=UPI0019397429|nr:uncharacterized protein LOC120342897 isoform X1 [Styela clava]
MQRRKRFVGIEAGDTFSCFEDLKKTIDRVQDESEILLYMRDSVTLKGAVKKRPRVARLANPDLVYHSILYICVFGRRDSQKAKTTGRRSVLPEILKKNPEKCKAEIRIGLSDDFQLLEVRRICDVHNHDVSKKTFSVISEHRTLHSCSPKYRLLNAKHKKKRVRPVRQASSRVSSTGNNRLVQYIDNVEQAISTLQAPSTSNHNGHDMETSNNKRSEKRKHTDAMPSSMKRPSKMRNKKIDDRPSYDYFSMMNGDLLGDNDEDDDDEEEENDFVDLLTVKKQLSKRVEFKKLVEKFYEVNGAITEVYEERMKPQAIYFQTIEMRKMFAAYPEVFIIDASHKIEIMGLTLYVVMNTDGNGQAAIVSLWFVTQENGDNLLYLIKQFKEYNPGWEQITVAVCGKEDRNRNLLMSHLPNAESFISYFHAMRNFRREIYSEKDNGFECVEEKHACLKIMKKMILAKNQEVYSFHFERLKLYAPAELFAYFMNNWHTVQDEWVDGLKCPFAYFLDQKNNRLDAINQIVKSLCDNFQTVPKFFHDLLRSIGSLQLERKQRALTVPVKGPVITSEFHIAEMQYKNLLTTYAFSFVKRQLHFFPKVKIDSSLNDEVSTIKSPKYGVLVTSISSCPCVFNTVTGLPCSHIFAVRKDKGVSTYDSSICRERWTWHYLRRTQDLPEEESNLVPDALFGYGETPPSTPYADSAMNEVIEESPSEADEAPFVPSYASFTSKDNVIIETTNLLNEDDQEEINVLQQIMKMRKESSDERHKTGYFDPTSVGLQETV